jgi:hypothetical protein
MRRDDRIVGFGGGDWNAGVVWLPSIPELKSGPEKEG